MSLTKHARARVQQRGIAPFVLDLLVRYGTSERADDGASLYHFDKQSRRRVEAYVGGLSRHLREDLDVYAILSSDGQVITAGHRQRRVQRDRSPR